MAAPTTRRLWAYAKLWAAMRDVPEVAVLAFLGTSALGMGFYTFGRMMWTPAGESFPSKEVRRDPEKQVAVAAAYKTRSIWYRIAQWNVDERGIKTGVFDNRFRPFEYNLPTQGTFHSGPQYEPTAAQPAPM